LGIHGVKSLAVSVVCRTVLPRNFPGVFWRRFFEVADGSLRAVSGVFENQDAAIIERDFRWLAKSGVGQTSW